MLRAFAKWALRHGASFAPAAQTERKRPITKPILQLNSEARYFAVTPERSGPFPAGNGGGAPLPSARGTRELRGRSRHSAARSRNGGRATSMLLGGEKIEKIKKFGTASRQPPPAGRPAARIGSLNRGAPRTAPRPPLAFSPGRAAGRMWSPRAARSPGRDGGPSEGREERGEEEEAEEGSAHPAPRPPPALRADSRPGPFPHTHTHLPREEPGGGGAEGGREREREEGDRRSRRSAGPGRPPSPGGSELWARAA